MNEKIEFTPKERYYISIHLEPDAMLKRLMFQWLAFIVASVALVAYSLWSGNVACGLTGYGLLLGRVIYLLASYKESLKTSGSIYRKYEALLQSKGGEG